MSEQSVATGVAEEQPVVLAYITAPTREVAEQIADVVVAERLAACANVIAGMTSVYRWNGAVQHDTEVVLICKTVSSRVNALEAKVKALHPYECPCIVVLPVVGGSAQFLAWVNAEARA